MTAFQNPSLQVTPDHDIQIVEAPIVKPGRNQVKIHIKATGICGTDIHFWRHGGVGDLKVLGNYVLGHECSGEIVEVGEGVTYVKVHDRVAIEPQIPCNECFICAQGDYNLCENVKFIGVFPYDGSMQRYLVHDARYVHKIPENMSYIQGALVEPVSVAYHGIERAKLKLGRGVFIAGAGPIGLSTLILAKHSGATPLCISDISKEKLDFVKSLVPEVMTYQIDSKLSSQENAKGIRRLFGNDEYYAPPAVLECTGIETSIITSAYVVRRSGTMVVVGVGKDTIDNFPFMHLSLGEVDVKFINRYHDSWPPVINLISSGIIDVDRMVSQCYLLENAIDAFEAVTNPKIATMKVVIED